MWQQPGSGDGWNLCNLFTELNVNQKKGSFVANCALLGSIVDICGPCAPDTPPPCLFSAEERAKSEGIHWSWIEPKRACSGRVCSLVLFSPTREPKLRRAVSWIPPPEPPNSEENVSGIQPTRALFWESVFPCLVFPPPEPPNSEEMHDGFSQRKPWFWSVCLVLFFPPPEPPNSEEMRDGFSQRKPCFWESVFLVLFFSPIRAPKLRGDASWIQPKKALVWSVFLVLFFPPPEPPNSEEMRHGFSQRKPCFWESVFLCLAFFSPTRAPKLRGDSGLGFSQRKPCFWESVFPCLVFFPPPEPPNSEENVSWILVSGRVCSLVSSFPHQSPQTQRRCTMDSAKESLGFGSLGFGRVCSLVWFSPTRAPKLRGDA